MTRNRYYDGPPSDHFDGVRFFNTGQVTTDRGLSDILRWKFAGRAATWPKTVAIEQAKPATRVDGIRVTMVGHASLRIQAAGLNILADPVWSDRASPFRFAGPGRVAAPGIALIPIGAYEPRWFMAEQHVDPDEAVRVFRDVGAGHALGTGAPSG